MGGTATYVWRDGARFTPAMLHDLERMDAAFFAEFGVHLVASSGVRLFTEQEAIFFARYVPSWSVNGRRVYDWRWYRGTLYARVSSAGTVAAPDSPQANHVLENGTGAADLRDTGADAGILTPGSRRALWMRANARRFNYSDEGYSFGEPWHWKYLADPWRAIPASGGSKPFNPTPAVPTTEELAMATQVIVTHQNRGVDVGDAKRRAAFVNTESGFVSEMSWLSLAEADSYAKACDKDNPQAIRLSDARYDAFVAALGQVRAG